MELKINYELIIKYLSKKSEKVDIHQKCNTQQRTDISFNKNNTFSKANTIVKTSLDSKANLVKTSLDSEANLVKTSLDSEANLVKKSLDSDANTIVKKSLDSDANTIVKTSLDSEATLVKKSLDSEDNLVKTSLYSDATLVKKSLDSEANLVKTSLDSEANLVKTSLDSEANLVKTSLDSEANLVKTSLDSEATIELYPNMPINNMFITQQNIFNYSINFPEIFKLIFNEKFYRYGIKNYDNDNNNISFWSSLLILIDKEYLIPYDNDELGMINQFKNQLLEKYTKRKNDISSFIKKLDKNNLRERFKLIPDINVLQYVADILEINLVIFNFETNKIEIVYPTNTINPFKQFLLFAKHNIFWEPIMLTKSKGVIQRLFTYNDVIIKKILTENQIEYLDGNIINKTYTFSNNFVSIIQQEKNKICPTILLSSTENTEESENNSVHTESDIFIESDINNDIKGINKTKLNKMKLAELLELSTKLKIETKKNSTRSILIDLIITKIKSNI
jgi:hypothetical protein